MENDHTIRITSNDPNLVEIEKLRTSRAWRETAFYIFIVSSLCLVLWFVSLVVCGVTPDPSIFWVLCYKVGAYVGYGGIGVAVVVFLRGDWLRVVYCEKKQ